jgi:fructose-1,6-bisphosphatase I
MNLKKHLKKTKACADVQTVILAAAEASIEIYAALKSQKIEYSTSENTSGETQLSHDLIADQILKEKLQASKVVSCFVSEERENELCFIDHVPEKLLVAFDPIDGSSVASSNFAVGTSLGIYRGVKKFTDATGRHQDAAVYFLYGPRIVCVYSVGEGAHLLSFNEKTKAFELEQENLKITDGHKTCSIGSLQKAYDIKGFPHLIDYWAQEQYGLRYSGSMAADINGILKRGGGVFAYPAPKLRLLYECNPFAFLVEQAGGKAVNMCGQNILNLSIKNIDDTSPILIGAKAEVETAEKFLADNCLL